jgi:hypothetical protein
MLVQLEMASLIYYLPGWADRLSTGLGKALMDRGFDVTGRETRGDFKDMSFTGQVEAVKEDFFNHPLVLTMLPYLKSEGNYITV